MAIIPLRSLPLFAFANDGSIAWLRAAGSKVMAVDAKSGEVLREVTLDPAPFGITWNIERVGKFFVVKDDREIAAYDAEAGTRLWKRSGPTRVAFVGEKGERHVTIAPGPAGVDVLEMDLATGETTKRVSLDGSMRYIGAHGAMAGDLLVFATDERDVYAVNTNRWVVVAHHSFEGSHALPPVATETSVHVAVIGQTSSGPVTTVVTLDGATGEKVSSHELPGAAHAMTRGNTGVVLDVKRTPAGMLERVAFRPHAPYIRLAIAKNVDVSVAVAPPPPRLPSRLPSRPPPIEIVAAPKPRTGRSEIPPAPQTDIIDESRPESARDGYLTLMDLMRVRSEVLTRIAETFGERPSDSIKMHLVSLRFRDPRVRWSAKPGRNPCLVDLAIHDSGDTIATYWYPTARATRLPVVRVDAQSGEARWLADDFDAWFAGWLHEIAKTRADAVTVVRDLLDLAPQSVRAARATLPPPWFFEAHGTRWTMMDVEEAMRGGDGSGAERMLVALGGAGYAVQVKDQLADIYETFGWGHHRAVVVETW